MYKKETTNLITKLICVNKVSKVITGGKKLSFAALVVVGDGKGRIGFGTLALTPERWRRQGQSSS